MEESGLSGTIIGCKRTSSHFVVDPFGDDEHPRAVHRKQRTGEEHGLGIDDVASSSAEQRKEHDKPVRVEAVRAYVLEDAQDEQRVQRAEPGP